LRLFPIPDGGAPGQEGEAEEIGYLLLLLLRLPLPHRGIWNLLEEHWGYFQKLPFSFSVR